MAKMLRQGKRFGMVAMAMLLSGALLLGSVMPVKAAEEKVVKIGFHGIYTGALATTGVPAGNAITDYISMINEKGGVDGVEIKLLWEETRGEVPRAITTHRRFLAAGVMAEISGTLAQQQAMTRALQRDEIPCVQLTCHGPGTLTKPIRWGFAVIPDYQDLGGVAIRWFNENWTEARRPRVGFIGYDHTSVYEWEDGIKRACEELDVKLVGREIVPMFGAIDTSVEWLRLAGKQPDLIMCGGCGATLTTLMKDCQRLEIRKGGIELMEFGMCTWESGRVAGAKACEGWYIVGFRAQPTDVESPGMKGLLKEATERWERVEDVPAIYVQAWITIAVLVEGIRLAVQKVGFKDLSGRAIRDGLASIRDFDVAGLWAPVTMSDDRPYVMTGAKMYRFQDGIWVPISRLYEFPGYFEDLVPVYERG